MSNQVTINDVRKALCRAHDCVLVKNVVGKAEGHSGEVDKWRRRVDEKGDVLVAVLADELGAGWTGLPISTQISSKAAIALGEFEALLSA